MGQSLQDKIVVTALSGKMSRTEMQQRSTGTALFTHTNNPEQSLDILSDKNKRLQLDQFALAPGPLTGEQLKNRKLLEVCAKKAPQLTLVV